MAGTFGSGRVLHLVVCAAPPAHVIHELVAMLVAREWDVHVITTPAAADWVDAGKVTASSGNPVHRAARQPGDARSLPDADVVVIAPATFNTINAWAAGINNTLALGVVNGALGAGIPMVASPYVKSSLAAHPAFGSSLDLLRAAGVRFTATEALSPTRSDGPFQWDVIVSLLGDTDRG
jgi:phosphopantothenoylcysteine decarboxylase